MGFRLRCGIKWSSGPDLHRPLAIIGRLLYYLSYRREIGTAPGNRTLPVGFGDQPVLLNICAVLVPEAGSAPAPAVWKTAMHLSTPLGHGNWWTGRESRPPQNPCQGSSPLRNMPAHWWKRRDLHPSSRVADATRPYGTCAPMKLVETGGFRTHDLVIAGHPLFLSELRPRGKWTRRRDLHPRASALQAGPLAARARRVKPQLRSLGAGRFLRTSALIDCG